MNLDRYEKINGREALKRLVDGEIIFDSYGTHYEVVHKPVFDEVGLYYTSKDGGNGKSRIEVSVFISNNWYIPKSFDVREAMLERPNEWVGAYQEGERWIKVGFDVKRMRPVRTFMNCEAKVNLHDGRVFVIELGDLDICIPIEDVPEEATR